MKQYKKMVAMGGTILLVKELRKRSWLLRARDALDDVGGAQHVLAGQFITSWKAARWFALFGVIRLTYMHGCLSKFLSLTINAEAAQANASLHSRHADSRLSIVLAILLARRFSPQSPIPTTNTHPLLSLTMCSSYPSSTAAPLSLPLLETNKSRSLRPVI